MKIYIAGPMSGYPEFNFPAFFAAQKKFEDAGWTVFNPANKDAENEVTTDKSFAAGDAKVLMSSGWDFRDAYQWDVDRVIEADAIYLLKGWEKSVGAQGELAVAKSIKLRYPEYEIMYEEEPATEVDPSGKSAKVAGAKLDAGKTPIFRGAIDYFPRALTKVAGVSFAGAMKYTWKGWESVPDGINRYSDAGLRHKVKESIEGPYDLDFLNGTPSQKILHKAQVAWNDLAVLELYLREHPEEME